MPKAKLPTNLRGWIIALISSFIGFLAGFVAIKVLGDWFND